MPTSIAQTAAPGNATGFVAHEGTAALASLAAHLNDPAMPLAYMLWAWRVGLPAAIEAGTAMGHFRTHAAAMTAMRWNPVANAPDLFEITTPPSLRAIETGWPAKKQVRHLALLLPDGAAQAGAAFQRLLRRKRLTKYRTVTVLVEGHAPSAAPIRRSAPSVRLLGTLDIAALMPRAKALAGALAKMAAAKARVSPS